MSIQELEEYFNTVELPEAPFYLDASTRIDNVELFLQSHLEPLKAEPNKAIYAPLYDRLLLFRSLILTR